MYELTLSNADYEGEDEFLQHIHKLTIKDASLINVSRFSMIHTLCLKGSLLLQDITPLRNVHTLDLSDCPNIRDVSALANVVTLNLSNTHIRHVAALLNVYDLNLSGCVDILDLHLIGNHFRLNVSYCEQLLTVEPYRFVYDLNCSHCWRLQDVSALRALHTLDCSHCPKITNVDALSHVSILNLSRCDGIKQIDSLQYVHSVDLSHCKGIQQHEALRTVHTLNLENCNLRPKTLKMFDRIHQLSITIEKDMIETIQALRHVNVLKVVYAPVLLPRGGRMNRKKITVDSLRYMYSLALVDASGIQELKIQHVANMKELRLENWKRIDLHAIDQLYSVTLKNCGDKVPLQVFRSVDTIEIQGRKELITDVRTLGQVRCLRLPRCKRLVGTEHLYNLEEIDLSFNRDIQDVSVFSSIKKVNVSGCRAVRDVSCLENVESLNISACPQIDHIEKLQNVPSLDVVGCHIGSLDFLKNVKCLRI